MPNVFVWNALTIFTLAVGFPLSVPLVALAYKVQNGAPPIPLESSDFWRRSAGAGVGLSVLHIVEMVLGYLLTEVADMAPGLVWLVLVLFHLSVAVWFLNWVFFGLEEIVRAFELYLAFSILFAIAVVPLIFVARALLFAPGA